MKDTHRTTIKVRGYHLDLYGHVNNARYLEFLEEARWGLLEEGRGLDFWHEQGLGFVVATLTINYRRPASLGTVLEIRSQMARMGGKSAIIHQEVVDSGTGKLIADADVTFVVFSRETGRPVALDGEIRIALGGDAFAGNSPTGDQSAEDHPSGERS